MKKMGTILYTGAFSLPDGNAAAHRVWNNAKAFRKLGYEVVFIDEQLSCDKELIKTKRQIENFVIFSRRKPHSARDYCRKMTDISPIRKLIRDYSINVVIVYNYPSIATIRLMREYGDKLKICADCTEWYSAKGRPFPFNIFVMWDSFVRMRVLNPRLDGVICISEYLYSYYRDRTKCIKIPPLIDFNDQIWHLEKSEKKADRLQLVCFDTPSPVTSKESVLPVVYSVINSDRDSNLRIIGITEGEFKKKYKTGAEKDYRGRLSFLGRISHEDSIRLISKSDYLLLWRVKNRVTSAGFSTKFVESITAGTPVITTDTGELREYINRYGLGKIAESEAEIVNALEGEEIMISKDSRLVFDLNNYSESINQWISRL